MWPVEKPNYNGLPAKIGPNINLQNTQYKMKGGMRKKRSKLKLNISTQP